MKTNKKPNHNLKQKTNISDKVTILPSDNSNILIALAVIVLISFIAYLPVLQNGLLNWDDDNYINNNPLIRSFNLKEIFSAFVLGNWHPLTILVYTIEYHLFGINAAGYHAVNLFLHLANVVLVFYAVLLISDKVSVALIASLLFGIHPMHVESVAWAAELKDLLYTLFFLASYIFYLKYLKAEDYRLKAKGKGLYKYYYLALVLFTLSLLSKAMAASLPLVLILTDYFKGRKIDKRALAEKAPFFLLAVIFGVMAIIAQESSGSILQIATIPQRIVFASYGFITYLVKLVLPMNLSAFYPYPVNNYKVYVPPEFYAYVIAFIGIVVSIIYSLRFSKKIIFGIGFFMITILFVLQLFPVGKTIMADRYSYIPSIGIFYIAGEGLIYLWNKNIKWATVTLLSLAAVLFSVKTYARCGVWNNDEVFWNDVIDRYPTIDDAYLGRGIYYMNEKRDDKAINDFNRAIQLNPGYFTVYNDRGLVYMDERRNDEAVTDFNEAIELNPKYAEAYNNRGIVFIKKIRISEAIRDFNKAIELKPDYAFAWYNKGFFEYLTGNKSAGCTDLKKAVDLGYEQAAEAMSRMCK